jgi:hypothetical protein
MIERMRRRERGRPVDLDELRHKTPLPHVREPSAAQGSP